MPTIVHKKWVLLVEDDVDVQEVMGYDLEAHFDGAVKIITAKDCLEATRKLTFQAFETGRIRCQVPNAGHTVSK